MIRVAYFLLAVFLSFTGAQAQQSIKGSIGAELRDLTGAEADGIGFEAPRGAKVVGLEPNGPAEKAGLMLGDVLDTLDSVEIDSKSQFEAEIATKAPGAEIKLRIVRNGKTRRVPVTLASAYQESTPTNTTVLMLDPAGHQALIRGLAFTPDGKYVVSAGEDKVIRVWDWRKGETVRTIRGKSNIGDEGRIYALAISPDGQYLAVGGWVGSFTGKKPAEEEEAHQIRLYDLKSGEMIGRLKGHRNVVNSLTFSPNSKMLASGGGVGDHTAIIWDVENRREIVKLKGHTGEIFGVSFSPDNQRIATASYDKSVRLWRVDGTLLREMTGHGNKVQNAIFIPGDGNIISGDWNGEMRLWDGRTGQFIRVFGKQPSHIGSLAVSPDGRFLVSTCGYSGCEYTQHVWNIATGEEVQTYKQHNSIVLVSAFSPDGRLIVTAGGDHFPIYVWDFRTGQTVSTMKGIGEPIWAVGFSKDGRRIGWGHKVRSGWVTNDYGLVEQSLLLPASNSNLESPDDVSSQTGWMRGIDKVGPYSLKVRKGGTYGFDAILDVLKDGQVTASIELGPTNGYQHRSYSFTPDGQTIISGAGNGVLAAFTLDGKRIGEFNGHEGDVWGVVPSPDGRYLLSGANDQTVRLWNLKTRELLLTYFGGENRDWVVWTPEGYYTGSPGADKIVGWQINKGPDAAADYVTAEQLRKHLLRPDIVKQAIILASSREAIKRAPGTNRKLEELITGPRPKFAISAPPEANSGEAFLTLTIDANPDPIRKLSIEVNGTKVPINDAIREAAGKGPQRVELPLFKGKNEVRVSAENGTGETSQTLEILGKGAGDLDQRNTLYILAIGVSDYPNLRRACRDLDDQPIECLLPFAKNDAISFAETVKKRLGTQHKKVVSIVMYNGAGGELEPTAGHIRDKLALFRQAGPNDTVVLYVQGHGQNDDRTGNYRFLPTEAAFEGGSFRQSTILPWVEFDEAISGAYGRRLMFIDTCYSRNAYNEKLGNGAYFNNVIAYFSAGPNQSGLWNAQLGHSLFAAAAIEGLDKGVKPTLTTDNLFTYVKDRVKKLAADLKRDQEPQYFLGRDARNYTLASTGG